MKKKITQFYKKNSTDYNNIFSNNQNKLNKKTRRQINNLILKNYKKQLNKKTL